MLSFSIKKAYISSFVINGAGNGMVLFPGQGALKHGWIKPFINRDIMDIFDQASSLLEFDLMHHCMEGPLQDTTINQPATFMCSLAAILAMKDSKQEIFNDIGHVAGFSLGEYTALVASGVLSWTDALFLVKERARLMQKAADATPSGLISVVGLTKNEIDDFCAKYNLCIANHLFEVGFVLAGNMKSIQLAHSSAKKK